MTLQPANDAFAERLAALLPQDTLREATPRYHEEPRGQWKGHASWVALPRCTEDVATIIKTCATSGVGVVPYGGGTGLVGGQIQPDGPQPLILSLERMNKIRAVYPQENVLVAEAGAILASVQAAAQDEDRLFPMSLASEGSAQLGGLLSTNAGGVNVLRYGNTRDMCLGLEAVMPDGQIWNGLRRLRKDNTGYDLRHLMIGAEGTLGVITAASVKLAPLPRQYGTAILIVDSPAAALQLLSVARDVAGDAISAFELLSGVGLDFLAETLPDLRRPFETNPSWMVLIDLGLLASQEPEIVLGDIFEAGMAEGLVSDGLIAQSQTQRQDFWAVREHIPEGNKRIGSISSHDISIPLSVIPEFIERGSQVIAKLGDFRINCFGHLGDGNLHYNVFPLPGHTRGEYADMRVKIKQTVHDLVHEMGGSFSAEHGVGRLKVADLERYGDPAKLAAMRAIKKALDPAGIMNPGAVLRD